jgi:putative flippase GtrA
MEDSRSGMIELTWRFFTNPLILQLMRFGIVGVCGAAVNFAVVVLLVHFEHFAPLDANIIAFFIAFFVSYNGHRLWTFKCKRDKKTSMPRFFLIQGASFFLYEGLFAVFLKVFHLYYMLALLLTLMIVPPFTFLLSKVWAFSK